MEITDKTRTATKVQVGNISISMESFLGRFFSLLSGKMIPMLTKEKGKVQQYQDAYYEPYFQILNRNDETEIEYCPTDRQRRLDKEYLLHKRERSVRHESHQGKRRIKQIKP